MALEQGREVLAVPGSIDRPTSAGPNRLIRDGAHPVTESADILAVLWPQQPIRKGADPDAFAATLTEPARSVWLALGGEPRHVDELAGVLGLTAGELSVILLHLELQGGVEQLPGARYLRATAS
jgi:DNA processing protein